MKRKASTLNVNQEEDDSKDEEILSSKKSKKTLENMEETIMLNAANKLKSYSNSKAYDESLSNQMLVGIPEVDLGIEYDYYCLII